MPNDYNELFLLNSCAVVKAQMLVKTVIVTGTLEHCLTVTVSIGLA